MSSKRSKKTEVSGRRMSALAKSKTQILDTAKAMGIDLRWGGDWDRDTEVRDNSFDDLVHFEIVGE